MKRLSATSVALLLLLASPARADDLKEMIAQLPAPDISSQKSAAELELCIGVGSSDVLIPATMHGPHQTLIYASNGNGKGVAYVISIEDKGSQRTIAVRAGRSFDDRLNTVVRSCASDALDAG